MKRRKKNRRQKKKRNVQIEQLKGRFKSSLSGLYKGIVIGLLIAIQFALILLLPYLLRNITVYFYVLLEIASIIVILSLVNDNRSPSYKISWICICLALPVSGHVMFILWGNRKVNRKRESIYLSCMNRGKKELAKSTAVMDAYKKAYPYKSRLPRYLERMGFPLTKNNQLHYFPMGEDAFESLFEDLEKAKDYILIDFFIVAEGALWDKVHEILLRKLSQGVEVCFMYDDFGAMMRTEKDFAKKLREEGIQVRIFNPIHKYTDRLYMNYRSHQKIVVIDGVIGYTGGFNLADEYVNIIERFGTWKDNGIRVLGEAAWGLAVTFLQMWEICEPDKPVDYARYRKKQRYLENSCYCQAISDGPCYRNVNVIENAYLQLISYATDFIYITTPYLIIEENMRDALIVAAKSGVDVRIITPFIPDKKGVKLLTNYNYGILLKNGIRIYEYTPGFIHAKTIICEDSGIIGTINMDYRSFYLHYENGVYFSDKRTVHTIRRDLMEIFSEGKEFSYEEWRKRPLGMKIKQSVLNLFSTLM